jgi:hypothetical protein
MILLLIIILAGVGVVSRRYTTSSGAVGAALAAPDGASRVWHNLGILTRGSRQ